MLSSGYPETGSHRQVGLREPDPGCPTFVEVQPNSGDRPGEIPTALLTPQAGALRPRKGLSSEGSHPGDGEGELYVKKQHRRREEKV